MLACITFFSHVSILENFYKKSFKYIITTAKEVFTYFNKKLINKLKYIVKLIFCITFAADLSSPVHKERPQPTQNRDFESSIPIPAKPYSPPPSYSSPTADTFTLLSRDYSDADRGYIEFDVQTRPKERKTYEFWTDMTNEYV